MLSLFLCFGIYLWRLEKEPKRETSESFDFLANFHEDALEKISIVRPEESYSIIRAENDRTHWNLKDPEDAPVDEARMKGMLFALSRLEKLDTIEEKDLESDERVYGLQPPELVLTVDGKFGRRVLSFGKKIEITKRRYAQPQGESRLFLVADDIFSAFNVGKDEVRDHFPLKFNVDEVENFAAARGGKDLLKFLRKDSWTLQFEGGEISADEDFVNAKLEALRQIRVKEFVDQPGENLALYGLSVPRLVIQLNFKADKKPLVFQIGEGVALDDKTEGGDPTLVAGKAYYMKVVGQPFIYRLTKPYTGDFLQAPEYFRPREPLRFVESANVLKIEVSGENTQACVCEHGADQSWNVHCEQSEAKVSAEFLDTWLRGLRALRVLAYPGLENSSAEDTGLKLPTTSYKIFLKERPLPLLLALGASLKSSKSNAHVEEENAPRWIAVSQKDGAFLPAIVNSEVYGILGELSAQLRK